MNLAEQYIRDVTEGNVVCNEYVKLAVKRHLDDLESAKEKGLFFDKSEGVRAIEFIKLLRHTKGAFARKFFNLKPFQAFIIYMVYGWRTETGLRRFRKCYMELARKNGKTELVAAMLVYELIMKDEQGLEIYTAATTGDQASIAFKSAKTMLRMAMQDSEAIRRKVKILKYSVAIPDQESFIQPLASDDKTLDGKNPAVASLDEYHAHKTTALLEVIESGMGARLEPLLLIITTAGFNKEVPCFKLRKVCIEILKKIKSDDAMFAIIYTLDEGDDWNEKENWIKANPNIGDSPYWDYMHNQYTQAINEGYTKEIAFKTKNLNVWTTTSATWIKDKDWLVCGTVWDPKSLKGRACYGGLDLASVRDVCSLALFFPAEKEGEKHKAIFYNWVNEENAKERTKNDGVGYLEWANDGYMTLTDGNVTDYNFIKADIMQAFGVYNIARIGYDRYNASQLVIDLTEEGVQMSPFGQGFVSMNAPTKELERLVTTKEIDHGQNPVIRWMMGNVNLKIDPAGNIKIDKGKSSEKVDGAVALVMAIGEWMTEKDQPSVYETQGVRVL